MALLSLHPHLHSSRFVGLYMRSIDVACVVGVVTMAGRHLGVVDLVTKTVDMMCLSLAGASLRTFARHTQ